MSEDSAATAALAFRHICDDCGRKLCGSLDGLFQIYLRAISGEGSFKVTAQDSLHLVEGLRYGVQLENGPFNRRTADFLWMMIFGASTLLVLAAFLSLSRTLWGFHWCLCSSTCGVGNFQMLASTFMVLFSLRHSICHGHACCRCYIQFTDCP